MLYTQISDYLTTVIIPLHKYEPRNSFTVDSAIHLITELAP
jgi:hypothetical protein